MAGRPVGSKNLPKIRDYINSQEIEKLVNYALKKAFEEKDTIMQRFLLEQVFGKAPQSMDLTSGGEILKLVVKPDDSDNKDNQIA